MRFTFLVAVAAAFVAGLGPSSSWAAEIPVPNAEAWPAALAAARPGDQLVLADGTWRDMRFELSQGGEAGQPVTLRARTPGGVELAGDSTLLFAAPHIVVEGLVFRGAAITARSLVEFRSTHGRLTDTAFFSCNPPDVAIGYYWIYFDGSHNRVDHCSFEDKSHQQPVIGNDHTDSRHNTVADCHFKDIPYVAARNGREIFRIWGHGGNEEMGDDGAFFTIERNLFDRADGEGAEIISLKSNRNIVRGNTILRTRGGITNRSGNFNEITDNVILCDGAEGAYGMRITGRHHVIARNFVRGGTFGLHLMAGEFIERDLTGQYRPIERAGTPLGRVPAYNQARENLVQGNVLVDIAGVDLLLGNGYKSGWPRAQRILLPEGNRLVDNLVFKPRGGIAVDVPTQDHAPPLDAFSFGPNHFFGNKLVGGTAGRSVAPGPEGLLVEPPSGDPPAPPRMLSPAEVGPRWRR